MGYVIEQVDGHSNSPEFERVLLEGSCASMDMENEDWKSLPFRERFALWILRKRGISVEFVMHSWCRSLYNNPEQFIPKSFIYKLWLDGLSDETPLTKVPFVIRWFHHLTELQIKNHDLTTVPEWLGKKLRLQILDLSYNQITHLPANLDERGLLRELYVSHNRLSAIPEFRNEHYNLTIIDYSYNQITSVQMKKNYLVLQTLNLNANQISSCELELPLLSSLYLEENNLRESWSLVLSGNYSYLRELFLSNNALRIFPLCFYESKWGKHSTLRYIDLSYNEFVFLALPCLPKQVTVILSNNRIAHYDLSLQYLNHPLHLHYNPILSLNEPTPLSIQKRWIIGNFSIRPFLFQRRLGKELDDDLPTNPSKVRELYFMLCRELENDLPVFVEHFLLPFLQKRLQKQPSSFYFLQNTVDAISQRYSADAIPSNLRRLMNWVNEFATMYTSDGDPILW